MKLHIAILLLAAGVFASCKSNSTSSNSNNNNNNGGGTVPTTPNTIVFTANGTTYTDTCIAVKTTASGVTSISVGGGSGTANQGIGFSLSNESSTGVGYEVGPITLNGNSASFATMEYSFNTSGDSGAYSSPVSGGSSVGTITIASISATSIQATFNGTLTLLKGNGPSTISITNGGVNANFVP
jgi:hypothetical protein